MFDQNEKGFFIFLLLFILFFLNQRTTSRSWKHVQVLIAGDNLLFMGYLKHVCMWGFVIQSREKNVSIAW